MSSLWSRVGNTIVTWAPAKVNLTLEVLGKRADGYHAIESLMVAVDLFDTLEFQATADGCISLSCEPAGLPTDQRNLVMKAAERLKTAYGVKQGAAIRLIKRIPSEAGLGGGSSDAASSLQALNALWGLNASPEELQALAATVGSDVAFFLSPPAGWCTGRGEIVSPERVGCSLDLVIVKPGLGLSTAEVYRRVNVPEFPVDASTAREALRAGDVHALGNRLFNRLQEPAFAVEPSVMEWHRRLLSANPLGCQLSGSGSAVFALCRDRLDAQRIAGVIQANICTTKHPGSIPHRVFVVRSWPF